MSLRSGRLLDSIVIGGLGCVPMPCNAHAVAIDAPTRRVPEPIGGGGRPRTSSGKPDILVGYRGAVLRSDGAEDEWSSTRSRGTCPARTRRCCAVIASI